MSIVEDWPDRLDDVSYDQRQDLILADPARYMAQARAEAYEVAKRDVDEHMRRAMAERDAWRRSLPWWAWRRWWV